MSILWTILVGFLVGLVARFLLPGPDRMGFIMTTVLGVVGSIAAGYAGQALGLYHAGQGAGFIGSVVGAVVVLFLFNRLTGRRR